MASKMAAIVRNRDRRYLVCNNFLKNVFTTNKTPRLCFYITKVIITLIYMAFRAQGQGHLQGQMSKLYQNYISRVQLYPFKVSMCSLRSRFVFCIICL